MKEELTAVRMVVQLEPLTAAPTVCSVAGKKVVQWDTGLVVEKAAWWECESVGLWVDRQGFDSAGPSVVWLVEQKACCGAARSVDLLVGMMVVSRDELKAAMMEGKMADWWADEWVPEMGVLRDDAMAVIWVEKMAATSVDAQVDKRAGMREFLMVYELVGWMVFCLGRLSVVHLAVEMVSVLVASKAYHTVALKVVLMVYGMVVIVVVGWGPGWAAMMASLQAASLVVPWEFVWAGGRGHELVVLKVVTTVAMKAALLDCA